MFKELFLQKIISSSLLLLLGVLLISLNGQVLANILFILLGIFILISNFNDFILSCKNLKYKTSVAISQFITSCLSVLLAILIIIFREKISFYIGIFLLILFIFNLFLDKKDLINSFINHLPLLIISIILMVFGFGGVLDLLSTIVGIILIVLSILSIISTIFFLRR